MIRPRHLCGGLLPLLLLCASAQAGPDLTGRWRLQQAVQALAPSDGSAPPLLPAAAAQYAANHSSLASPDPEADSMLKCLPAGTPRIYLQPRSFLIVQRPAMVAFFFEHERMNRFVYLRGVHGDVPDTLFMGHAIGRWEGDTLVVDSDHFKDGTFLDNSGLPHSSALHLVERFRLLNRSTLEDTVWIEDSMTFSHPWSAVLHFDRQPDLRMQEDLCSERLGLW